MRESNDLTRFANNILVLLFSTYFNYEWSNDKQKFSSSLSNSTLIVTENKNNNIIIIIINNLHCNAPALFDTRHGRMTDSPMLTVILSGSTKKRCNVCRFTTLWPEISIIIIIRKYEKDKK